MWALMVELLLKHREAKGKQLVGFEPEVHFPWAVQICWVWLQELLMNHQPGSERKQIGHLHLHSERQD